MKASDGTALRIGTVQVIFDLPLGSTPLDFAYRIHTNIGHHCQRARVNGNIVRLDYKLKTNDVVEILTSNAQIGPSRDWLNIVKTQSARNKIRQWFKKANREENVQKGKEMLEDAAKRHGQQLAPLMKPEYIKDILERHNFVSVEDMYSAIGFGGISSSQVLHRLIDLDKKSQKLAEMQKRLTDAAAGGQESGKRQKSKVNPNGIIVRGDSGMAVRFGNCCNPLPGDPIVGYITRGRGVSVHRADCKNMASLRLDADRIIDVEWSTEQNATFAASLRIHVLDQAGALLEISRVFTTQNINITDLNCKVSNDGYGMIDATFIVRSTQQLEQLLTQLRQLKTVTSVFRLHK